jgi:hypothetical protein
VQLLELVVQQHRPYSAPELQGLVLRVPPGLA